MHEREFAKAIKEGRNLTDLYKTLEQEMQKRYSREAKALEMSLREAEFVAHALKADPNSHSHKLAQAYLLDNTTDEK